MENAPNSNNDKTVGWVSNPPTTPIGVDNTNNFRQPENQPAVGWASQPTTTPTGVDYIVKSNLRFDGGLETHPTAETTISVILSDSEESLSNIQDSSPTAQNDDNNKDSSLATQVQNDGNLSGCLKLLNPFSVVRRLPRINFVNARNDSNFFGFAETSFSGSLKAL